MGIVVSVELVIIVDAAHKGRVSLQLFFMGREYWIKLTCSGFIGQSKLGFSASMGVYIEKISSIFAPLYQSCLYLTKIRIVIFKRGVVRNKSKCYLKFPFLSLYYVFIIKIVFLLTRCDIGVIE